MTGDGALFLAMEWIDGQDLATKLSGGSLTLQEAVTIGARLAGALAVVHAAGIVHRDLKPSNVMLPGGDVAQAKIVDFGIAHVSRTLHAATRLTRTGVMIGTPGYVAPEQVRGGVVDVRTDLFALGAVLYECVTGLPAFAGDQVMALLAKILFEPAPRLRDSSGEVPEALDVLVTKLLERDPAARPSSAREVATALGELEPSVALLGGGRVVRERSSMLGPGEQRVVTVVAAPGEVGSGPAAASLSETWRPEDVAAVRERAMPLAARHGGSVEVLADGSVVALFERASTATEQAVRAARFALALAALVHGAPITVVTGRSVVSDALPVGDVIERAVRVLRSAAPGELVLDEATADLLDDRFVVERAAGDTGPRVLLRGVRSEELAVRTLLGRRTPCVGRRRELTMLATMLDECVSEPVGRAVLVIGEPGLGKSRVVHEVVAAARIAYDPLDVFVARGDPMRAGSAFALAEQIVRSACEISDGDGPPARRECLRARVAASVPAGQAAQVEAFLAEIIDASTAGDPSEVLRAARGDPRLMSDQIRTAFVDWLDAECARGPRLLVLEDLHWGDLPTVQLVGAALEALGDAPLMVVAAARPEVRDTFPRLWAERDVTELTLGRLSRRACAELVREVLGSSTDEARVARVVDRADGSPFFLEELVRAAAAGHDDRLPETVLATVEARIGELDPEARLVLRAASVFGERFTPEGIGALVGASTTGLDVGGWLDTLVAGEALARRGTDFTFRHALVREACYAMLTDDDRKRGHRLAGEWLEKAGDTEAITLARHFDRGGEGERAAPWYARAARAALDGDDLAGALERCTLGEAAGATGALLGELRSYEAEARLWRGEIALAGERAGQAVPILTVGTPAWCSAVGVFAEAKALAGAVDGLDDAVAALERVAPADDADREHVVDALCRSAWSFVTLGRLERARDLLAAAERHAARSHRAMGRGRLAHVRAVLALADGDLARGAAEHGNAALEFERCGAIRLALGARLNAALVLIDLGAYEEGVGAVTAIEEFAKSLDAGYLARIVAYSRGLGLARSGQLTDAAALLTTASRQLEDVGEQRLAAAARYTLAEVRLAQGTSSDAESEARRAVELASAIDGVRAAALGVLARILLEAGRTEEALVAASEGVSLAERTPMEDREVLLRLVYAEALERSGRRDAARSAIADAARRVTGRADLISDSDRRASFLGAVPENARALALAREWADSA